jgi:outer membrane protein assembly factor BamB
VCSPVSDGAVAYLADPTRVRAITLPQRPSARVAKKAEVRWDRRLRGPNVTSPVVCGGLMFCVSDSGQAACLDAASGEVLWQEDLPGQYFSSPVAAGGFIYFTNSDGHTSVWTCERAPKLVAENNLGEPVYASHAAVDGRLLIRTTDHLYCIAAAHMAASTPTRQAP